MGSFATQILATYHLLRSAGGVSQTVVNQLDVPEIYCIRYLLSTYLQLPAIFQGPAQRPLRYNFPSIPSFTHHALPPHVQGRDRSLPRATMKPPSTAASQQWSVAAACSLLNFMQTSGFFFTATTLMPLLVKDFNLDLALSTVPIAVGKVSYVLMLFPGGVLVDRFGPRVCVLFGITLLAALLSIYAAFVHSFREVVFMHVLMALASSVSGVPVYSLFIAQWFESGAIGVAMVGYSFFCFLFLCSLPL